MGSAIGAREVAMAAWQHLAEGHKSGNFASYLAMLTDDYTFSMPTGSFRGTHVGRAQASACYAEIAQSRPNLRYSSPLRVTETGDTVVIEFEDQGTIMDQPYRNRIADSFDVRDNQISGLREYFGDVDPDFIAAAAEATKK